MIDALSIEIMSSKFKYWTMCNRNHYVQGLYLIDMHKLMLVLQFYFNTNCVVRSPSTQVQGICANGTMAHISGTVAHIPENDGAVVKVNTHTFVMCHLWRL